MTERKTLGELLRSYGGAVERNISTLEAERDAAIKARDHYQVGLIRSQEAVAELVGALKLAREYVVRVEGTVRSATGCDNVVTPDLQKIDAALAKHVKAEGKDDG